MTEQADLKSLYPFLHGAAQEPKKLEAALLQSIADKALWTDRPLEKQGLGTGD